MSDDTIIRLDEWRHRRYAPPRRATPSLSRATRRRIEGLQLDSKLGAGAGEGIAQRALRAIFLGGFVRGLLVMAAIVITGILAWCYR